VRSAVLDVQDRLDDVPQVRSVVSPFPAAPGAAADPAAAAAAAAARGSVSADGRAVLVSVQLAPGLDRPQEREAVARVTALLEAVPAQVPGSTGSVGGLSALIDEINTQVNQDLRTGEQIALPLSLLVMVVVFGGFLAAGLPIIGAIASSAGALVSLLGFSYLIGLDSSVVSVVSVLGLGLSIDYGLLLVSRYREELRASSGAPAADRGATGRRAGTDDGVGRADRGVQRGTVAISLSGLLLFEASLLRAVGAAGGERVCGGAARRVDPGAALMVVSGDRLIRPGCRCASRVCAASATSHPRRARFSRLARWVQRPPVTVIVGVLLVLGPGRRPGPADAADHSGQALLPVTSPSRSTSTRCRTGSRRWRRPRSWW
jgi:RND superfamily putative drug exporter